LAPEIQRGNVILILPVGLVVKLQKVIGYMLTSDSLAKVIQIITFHVYFELGSIDFSEQGILSIYLVGASCRTIKRILFRFID